MHSKKNLLQCHFAHNVAHLKSLESEPKILLLEARVQPPELSSYPLEKSSVIYA
jgi:hypothetical protein